MKIRLNDAVSSRAYDDNGFLIIKDNPIAKAGVFDYLGSELDTQENIEKDKIYKVCRTFEDLKENKDLFKGKPIKQGHAWVGDSEESQVSEGAIFGEIKAEEPYLKADIIIYTPNLIKQIENNKIKELSPGYQCSLEHKKGTYNGEKFEFIQSLKNVNHLAVVENGRSGSDLRILDKGISMSKKALKRVLDSLKVKLKDSEPEEVEKASDSLEEITKAILEISNSDSDYNVKEEAIKELLEQLSPQSSEDEDKTSDEEDEEEKENKTSDEEEDDKTSDEDKTSDDDLTTEEIIEIIEKVTDAKIKRIHDSMYKENKKIMDAYSEVSKALGTNFDYSNKTYKDIFKFGYETITKQKLKDDMDALTAFRLVSDKYNKKVTRVNDSTIKGKSEIDKLIDSL